MRTPTAPETSENHTVSTTLGASAYTDKSVFDTELEKVFAHSWQYVGHVERVSKPGDYFVTKVAGESLLITRSSDGDLNVLFNVCAHRAARVAAGEGCKERFSCPYHGWTYDAKGRLLHAPNAEQVAGMRIQDYALSRCAVEEVHGLIFVNLDSKCAPLAELAPTLADDIRVYVPALPKLRFAHRTEALLETNWKVAVENFSECYHCPLVHRSFFSAEGSSEGGGVDPSSYRIELNGVWHKHHGGTYEEVDISASSNAARSRSNEFGGWWLWPNFAIQSHPGALVNIRQWVPIDVNLTHIYVDWYLSSSEPNQWEKEVFADHASGVFAEDIPIVEMVQAGLSSRGYRGGPLMADGEGSVLSEHAVAAIQDLWREAMQ